MPRPRAAFAPVSLCFLAADHERVLANARWELGKRCYFLEDDEDWTPVPMNNEFWRIVAGGLEGLRGQLCGTT